MRIVVFGAAGRAGSAIVAEARRRGHETVAVARTEREGIDAVADVTSPSDVAAVAKGADVVIDSVYDPAADPGVFYPAVAEALIEGIGDARLVHITLSTVLDGPGGRVVDHPEFPEAFRPFCLGHAAGLDVLAASPLTWTALSPVTDFDPDATSSGHYELSPTGPDSFAAISEDKISFADFALAVVDEAEKGAHTGRHLGVA